MMTPWQKWCTTWLTPISWKNDALRGPKGRRLWTLAFLGVFTFLPDVPRMDEQAQELVL
jgi:hypothetical protein